MATMLDGETERRLALATAHLGWTPTRVSAFREGYSAARPDRARHVGHRLGDGYADAELSEAAIDALGYDDGLHARRMATHPVETYGNDPERVASEACSWASMMSTDVREEDCAWSLDVEGSLAPFLAVMSREEWVDWIVREHGWALEDGREGYAALLIEDVKVPVVYVEHPDGTVDIWDGHHRVGACMLKGAASIPVIRGVAPAPVPTP